MYIFSLLFAVIINAIAIQPRLNVTTLVTLSDRITVAYVSSSEVRWAAGSSGGLETIVWITPTHHLKGQPVDTIELLVQGGQLGPHQTWVEDEASLAEGSRYLLFLHSPRPNVWRVIGGPQGVIELRSHNTPDGASLETVVRSLELVDAD